MSRRIGFGVAGLEAAGIRLGLVEELRSRLWFAGQQAEPTALLVLD
jgi:hypothetical protein